MSTILGILLVFGFITFTTYEIICIVQTIRERKKSKIQNKEDIK